MVLIFKKKRLSRSEISCTESLDKSFEMVENRKFRIENSMVQISVSGKCKLRICEFSY